MVGVYDSIESFYASDDPFRYTYEGFTDSTSIGSGYQDYGFGSEPPSFMNLGDTALGYDPYRAEQLAEQRFAEEDDFGYDIPITGYRGGDPRAFAEEGEILSRDEFFRARGAPDDRSYFKMLQEYLGLDDLLSEKDFKFVKAFASAAGLLDKGKVTGAELGRTAYKPKTKTPTMKQAAAISRAKRTANNMASLSRTAPNGNQYLQRQNFNDFVNRVSTGDFGTTGSGPRGTNIKEANLKAIAARKYVPKA